MPRLQYPNPNKPFKLFTDASLYSYSGILHQEEVSIHLNAVAHLVPTVYFLVHSVKHNCCGTLPKRSVMQSIGLLKCFHST